MSTMIKKVAHSNLGLIVVVVVVFHFYSVESSRRIRYKITPPIQSFHGRGEFLAKLHVSVLSSRLKLSPLSSETEKEKELHQHHHHQIKFITGPPAIGKTEAVRKYVEKYGSTYKNLIWLNALGGEESVKNSLIDLMTGHKKIFNSTTTQSTEEELHKINNVEDLVQKIYSKMVGPTLLIFDDVPPIDGGNGDFLHKFLPPPPNGPQNEMNNKNEPIILVISKKFEGHWAPLCDDIEIFPLAGWTSPEQIDFILDNIGLLNDFEKDDPAKKDAKELGQLLQGIPLAIQLATAFVKETRMGMADYVQMYGILDEQKNSSEENSSQKEKIGFDPIYSAWLMTRHELEETDEGNLAIEVMEILSILQDCDQTPQILLRHLTLSSSSSGGEAEGAEGSKNIFDKDQQENLFSYSLSILENYGLVRNMTGEEDHGEVIQCQKQISKLVKENMKPDTGIRLQSSVLMKAGHFLNKIFQKDHQQQEEQNPNFLSLALTCLEKFAESNIKSRIPPHQAEEGVIKNKMDIIELKKLFQSLALKLKIMLVYEKMEGQKMGTKVKILMGEFAKQFEIGVTHNRDDRHGEKLAEIFMDDVLKFYWNDTTTTTTKNLPESQSIFKNDDGQTKMDHPSGGGDMLAKILLAMKENLMMMNPSQLYTMMEEWRKNFPKPLKKVKKDGPSQKKKGKKKAQNKFKKVEL